MLYTCFYASVWPCFASQPFVPDTIQQLKYPLFRHLWPFENSPHFLLVAQPTHSFPQKPFTNFPWGTRQVLLLVPNLFCFGISAVPLPTCASSLACCLKDRSQALLSHVLPRKSLHSSQGPSGRIQTFPEKTPACPYLVRAQQHVLHVHYSQLFLFI